MNKGILIIALCLLAPFGYAQEVVLPSDFRQHNLTAFNSSFFSPVFALDRNQPESIAFWSRWQWQTVDLDPSTFFMNYSRMLNPESAVGITFFQHNTGTFLQTGGAVNYAYVFRLEQDVSIALGMNLFLFSRSLVDDPFQANPGILLPPEEEKNQFLLQAAPALQVAFSDFSLGLVGENLSLYNFTTSEGEAKARGRIYLGYASYAIPIENGTVGGRSFVRPMLYYKTIPGSDNQIGLTTLYSTPKYWAQGGYNSFYGISIGLGARVLGNFSIGTLVEFGLDNALEGRDPSFEFITAYTLGAQDLRKKVVGFEVEDDEEVLVPEQDLETEPPLEEEPAEPTLAEEPAESPLEKERTEPSAEEIAEAEARIAAAREQRELERQLEAERQRRRQQVQDSLAAVRAAEKEKEEAAVQPKVEKPKEDEQPDPGEKYQESTITKEGVAPGYYLIVNVFGNRNYYNTFMQDLKKRGLNPGSFLRPVNNYNYVYLERYDTVGEARAARRSRYNGRYTDDIWIFAVLPD